MLTRTRRVLRLAHAKVRTGGDVANEARRGAPSQIPDSRVCFEMPRNSLYSVAGQFLSAILIGATVLTIVLSFRFGIDRGHDIRIASTGIGHFWLSVCAILSRGNYGTGRYVCSGNASGTMQATGLGYDHGTLASV